MKQSKKEKLYIVTNRILTKIENTQNDSVKKAVLANFRKSIGKCILTRYLAYSDIKKVFAG